MAAVFLLVPIQFLVLPLNMSVADLFGFAVLPVCWMLLIQAHKQPVLPLLPAMWAILVATGCTCLFSIDPGGSLSLLAKEIYLYLWLVTVTTVFAHADAKALQRLLIAWCAAAYLNGALIVAQFVSPPLLDSMNALVAPFGKLDVYRPSGLMENSNAAALFQLSAFVPLVLLRMRRARLLLFGAGLLLTILATGSMGSSLAFATGLVAGLLGMIVLFKDWRGVLQFSVASALGASVVALVVLVLLEVLPGMDERIQYVLTGRSDYSAEGRFVIWQHGLELFFSDFHIFGIGPDMFRTVTGKELHNDGLSFLIERGPLALFALVLFAAMAASHAVRLARWGRERSDHCMLVFVPGIVALCTVTMTHEIFHQRPIWMLLALQEAFWWRTQRQRGLAPRPDSALPGPVHRRAASTTRRTVSIT